MPLKDFKVLTFDVVGTLIDFEGGMLAYLRKAVPGSKITDEDFLAAYRAARSDGNTGWYPDDLERCWHVIAPGLGLPDTPELARGLRDSVADWPAFPDSVEALQRLRKHYKLVTMTNAQTWALQHFARTLGEPFDLLLSCDDALCEKPDPQYFAYARGRIEGAWGYRQADNLHVAQSSITTSASPSAWASPPAGSSVATASPARAAPSLPNTPYRITTSTPWPNWPMR